MESNKVREFLKKRQLFAENWVCNLQIFKHRHAHLHAYIIGIELIKYCVMLERLLCSTIFVLFFSAQSQTQNITKKMDYKDTFFRPVTLLCGLKLYCF